LGLAAWSDDQSEISKSGENQMKELWLVRHAESMGNAGHKTESTAENPLTELGQRQAQSAANYLMSVVKPDGVIHSSYLRTEQTAEPYLSQLNYRPFWQWTDPMMSNDMKPLTPVEVWDIHEYTYLSASKYANTSIEERVPARDEYWGRMDPDYMDGDGAESFNQMIGRVERFLRHFLQSRFQTAVAFTHGQFMKGVLCLLQAEGMHGRLPTMQEFYAMQTGMDIPNTGILKLNFSSEVGSTRVSYLRVKNEAV
jgi:broad specificity phosphatase PhoE